MIEVKSIMSGSVWKILVEEGEQLEESQEVVILESMKMEVPIEAERKGVVTQINVSEGDFVNEGDVVLVMEGN